jgi:hypothetical protein
MKKVFIDFDMVSMDLNDLDAINSNIWFPSETDKEYMSQSAFDDELRKANTKKVNLIFSNIRINYDSCDCGEGWGCSHGRWPYQIIVSDGEKEPHVIEIENQDSLAYSRYVNLVTKEIVPYYKKDSKLVIASILRKIFLTYGDFIRFCNMSGIPLKSDKYTIPAYSK